MRNRNRYILSSKDGKETFEGTAFECAEKMGIDVKLFYSQANRKNSKDYDINLKNKNKRNWHTKKYYIYEKTTNKLIVSGNSEECCQFLGLSLNNFYSMVSKTITNKTNKYSITIETIEKQD